MRFFFVDQPFDRPTGPWTAPPELTQHLRALRLQGESFALVPPEGPAVGARIAGPGAEVPSRRGLELELEGPLLLTSPSLLPVELATAWPKGSRAEDLLVRATEAGVQTLRPIQWARSAAPPPAVDSPRWIRWERLLRERCEQCGRPVPPVLEHEVGDPLVRTRATAPALPVVLAPGAPPLFEILAERRPAAVVLLVGPEGGVDEAEAAALVEAGAVAAGLGPTVLRIEAAGPLAVGLVQHWWTMRKDLDGAG